MNPTIVWFRRNLRLTDNPCIRAAAESGRPVIAVYVADEQDTGGASSWWLHHSLESLDRSLRDRGGRLIVRTGDPAQELAAIADEASADTIAYARRYEPVSREQERRLESSLSSNVDIMAIDDALLTRPGTVLTQSEAPYKVFTPFWRAATDLGDPDEPGAVPASIEFADTAIDSLDLDDLDLLPTKPDWAGGLRDTWRPGEQGALARLDATCELLDDYKANRDRPDLDDTSRLSPHLHFGEVSIRQVWHAARQQDIQSSASGASAFLRQLYWRDFSAHLLFHFPEIVDTPLRPEFGHFPWSEDKELLRAWQRGRTGFPIVDAGMNQLWESGWMHNRVRMIVASFLVKDLMIPWQHGAEWFLDTLVDADLANNSASWQWVAGCGTDAAPFFRIFNPERQAEKFDPDGAYVRRWLPDGYEDSKDPIVDHGEARQRALDAYSSVKGMRTSS